MDRAQFLRIYQSTVEPLRRYVARTLGAANADDVVQEAFTRALTSASLPAAPAEARLYLFRVASNLVADHWRRLMRDRELSLRMSTPETQPVGYEIQLDLAHLFGALSVRERQLLWLAYIEGLEHEKIALVLEVGASSVKVMLHRARRRLAMLLEEAGYDG
ncbi:MAG: RNA polymerase sigma factor [Rhodomicrobium sp.]|nr:RNA polymerase sigma factor [Rhodomicrobium sp.]